MGPTCRNCGHPAGPRFCGHCGQALDERRRPLLGLAREVLADWLSLDGRLFRSLAALPRPGRLTLLHREGKRAPYLRPLRLYLLASLALFSTVLALRPPDAARIDLYIGDQRVIAATETENARSLQILDTDTLPGRLLERGFSDKLDDLGRLPPQQVLDSLYGSLRRYLPAALILFVPFLAAGLKLLYVRTKTLYLDHLVFSLHFQSALFFALAAAWLVGRLLRLGFLPGIILQIVIGFLMLTVYLGVALHRVHRQTRWRTAVKVLLLTFIYMNLTSWTVAVAVGAAIWEL